MAFRWLAIPAVVLLAGCTSPVTRYREAARQLTFTLDRVEPNVQLAFPLDQSRLTLRLVLGVDNPSTVNFKVRSVTGQISLDAADASHPVSRLDLVQGVDLKAGARTPMPVDLVFTYGELQQAWSLLRGVTQGDRSGTWRMEGQAGLEALGFPVTVPIRAKKRVGEP